MAVAKMKEVVGRTLRVANSKSEAGGVRCEVDVGGGHTVITDEPVARGGTDTATSPLMYLTTSLGSCQTVQIIKVAEAMRFKHGTIKIRTETVTDLIDGLEGNNKGVMHFVGAKLEIEIETNETPEKLQRLAALSEDRCPVGRLFADAGFEPECIWTAVPLAE
jgi:putative redox protein